MLGVLATSLCLQVTNSPILVSMSSPRRNTRHFNSPPGIGNPPPPGFQSVLNSLLAQRDAALGVSVPSQPIARWQSSSQPEILWELLAEQRRAGIPPTLSQEQDAALEAAIAHIPVAVVNNTIATMEEAVQASQGGPSPALTVVSDNFWEALQLALPASGIPEQITSTPSFTEARHPSLSAGSSPMDISSDLPSPGRLAAPAPPPPQKGDAPDAPIILSSDSDIQEIPNPTANTEAHAESEAASPLPASSMSGERPSDHFPSASVSFGDDDEHALELSSDSPLSSYHSSQAPDVPDMGPARKGGKMTSGRATVTVSPSPQSKDEENEKLYKLREYTRDFRRQHTTDAEQFDWDSDDGDYGLAIGRLVIT
jgi:hypothetical protein